MAYWSHMQPGGVAPAGNPGLVTRRDRYGEPIESTPDDLELRDWQGSVAHARRAAREALPERVPDPAARGEARRRVGLKTIMRDREHATRRRSR